MSRVYTVASVRYLGTLDGPLKLASWHSHDSARRPFLYRRPNAFIIQRMGSWPDIQSQHQPDRLTNGLLESSTPSGCLIPLRTKAEVQNNVQIIQAHVATIHAKSANTVLK
jgi:hypothetical protein